MGHNGDDRKFELLRKLFIIDILDLAKQLTRMPRVYLLEIVLDQTDRSFILRKCLRYQGLKQLKATFEKELANCDRGEMTFDEIFAQLKELMVKLQKEYIGCNVNFIPVFSQELNKLCGLISQKLLMYQIDPDFSVLFETPEELNRFAVKNFQRTFFLVLLTSIEAIINDLRTRDELEMELARSQSSTDLSSDSDETDL